MNDVVINKIQSIQRCVQRVARGLTAGDVPTHFFQRAPIPAPLQIPLTT